MYESIDWPMQRQFQRQVKLDPDLGVIVFDNVRLDSAGGRGKFIRSGFVESFVTKPRSCRLARSGRAERLPNRFVPFVNTNDGFVSPDLLNRRSRSTSTPGAASTIDNPRSATPSWSSCPRTANGSRAELRGMIERWRVAGCPLDESVKHSMTPWARSIGGILRCSNFSDFLGNQQTRKAVDDPLRRAVGILGAAKPGKALRPAEWAQATVQQGLVKTLIPAE